MTARLNLPYLACLLVGHRLRFTFDAPDDRHAIGTCACGLTVEARPKPGARIGAPGSLLHYTVPSRLDGAGLIILRQPVQGTIHRHSVAVKEQP